MRTTGICDQRGLALFFLPSSPTRARRAGRPWCRSISKSPRRWPNSSARMPATLVGASRVSSRIILSVPRRCEVRSADDRRSTASRSRTSTSPISARPRASAASRGDPETFYAFSSYARPTTIYRFDTQTGKSEIFAEPRADLQTGRFHGRAAFLQVEGRHRGADVRRDEEGLDRSKDRRRCSTAMAGSTSPMTAPSRRRGSRGSTRAACSRSRTCAAAANMASVARRRPPRQETECLRRLHRRGRISDRRRASPARASSRSRAARTAACSSAR